MQGYTDEAEYLKNIQEAEANEETSGEIKDQWIKLIKTRLFGLFFRLNMLKISIAIHYHMLIIAIEAFQLMTLVMVDGNYTKMGPYDSDSPWNLEQTQWLIDVCWVFRIDRYFRINFVSFIVLMALWGFLIGSTIGLGILLAWDRRSSSLYNFLTKVLKALITLLTNLLFIPIMDSFAFGMKCSLKSDTECLGLSEGYLGMIMYVMASVIFLAVIALSSMLYYDFCQMCGGLMAKPHARFKLLRLASYVVVIFSFYFITTTGKVILFLVICLCIGLIEIYVFTQYMPYYNFKMCNLRLAAQVSFASAVFCMLIGEFFKSTDQTHSSVTMLFYFLTPCLVQIMQLAMAKRGKLLSDKKIQQLSNPYQVEIKARLLIQELDNARNKNVKSLYGETDEEADQELANTQTRVMSEIEALFSEAFRKFPNAEFLYLWSGLIQLHIFNNYILAMVQCFKGLLIANKLDSQYSLYHFRRTSESFYKANMKDDAYDYVLFEKCFANAQRNDEAVTRSQFYFWAELESKQPKIQKLSKLSGETARMISVAKSNYQKLLKLNSKNSNALRMYGHFLASLNNFSDIGQRYLQKAEMQDEAQNKNVNANVINSLTQPLSFFDNDNLIISVSGDFETIGEIQKVNSVACTLLGYLQAELVGRNISLLIPPPFADNHDENMRKYHEVGTYNIIDSPSLVLYFANKSGHIFEARLLVKVVPNDGSPPFFMAIIKPTNPNYEVILMNIDNVITGFSQRCSDFFELSNTKSNEQKISNILPRFDELKDEMLTEQGVVIDHEHDNNRIKLKCKLVEITIGKLKAHVLKIEIMDKKAEEGATERIDLGTSEFARPDDFKMRQISVLQSLAVNRGGEQKPADPAEISVDVDTHSTSQAKSKDVTSSYESGDDSQMSSEYESEMESGESADVTDEFEEAEESEGLVPESRFSASKELPKPKPALTNEGTGLSSFISEVVGTKHSGEESKTEDKSKTLSKSLSQSHSSSSGIPNKSESSSEKSDRQDEVDAHSAHSSSKSMTSSMASLAQFNKSIKALVSYEFSKTKKHVIRFKITLILTIVILIITSIMTFTVIDNSVSFNKQLSHFVNLVGDLRLYTQSLSYYARQISLMDSSFTEKDTRDEIFSWLQEDVDDMHDINLKLYKNYGLLSSEDRAVYIDENIASWLLEGGKVREIKTNLFDATSNYILQGYLTHEELKDTVISLKNRRAFYLYRNGNGETLSYLNTSAKFYVKSAQSDLENQRLTAILLIVASIVLLICCAGFAIVPAIRTIEKSKQEVWEIFFEIPPFVSRVMKAKCSDRLTLLNDTANIEIDDPGNDEIVPEDDKGDESGQKREHSGRKKDGDGKKKSKKEERVVMPYDPRQRKVMTVKLACFFVISIVYFYLIYYIGFDAVGEILKEEPIHVNWASRRKQLSRAINMWVNEALFTNLTDVGLKYVVPAGQNIGSPVLYATLVINELEFVENSLIFGNDDVGITFSEMRSQKHDDLLFENACTANVHRSKADCETVGNKAMMQGLHSALGMYITLARTLLLQIQQLNSEGTPTYSEVQSFYHNDDMKLLRDLDSYYLYDPLKESSELYEEDYQAHQREMRVWQNVLMSLYCVFSLLFFFFVYSPMINRIGQETKNSWSMCTLIPQEYQEEFKKLNLAIKERRDNFKWK